MPPTHRDLFLDHLDMCATCTPWSPRCAQGIALLKAAVEQMATAVGLRPPVQEGN